MLLVRKESQTAGGKKQADQSWQFPSGEMEQIAGKTVEGSMEGNRHSESEIFVVNSVFLREAASMADHLIRCLIIHLLLALHCKCDKLE